MFSVSQYFFGWSAYLAAVVGLLLVWWYMTRSIKITMLKQLLRITSAATLIMPYSIDAESRYMAPAVIMSLLEGLFVRDADFGRAGIPLLVGVILTLLTYLIVDLVWNRYWVKRQVEVAKETEQLKDHDELIAETAEVAET